MISSLPFWVERFLILNAPQYRLLAGSNCFFDWTAYHDTFQSFVDDKHLAALFLSVEFCFWDEHLSTETG